MNDRINLRLLFTVLAFACAICLADNAKAQNLLVEFESFENVEAGFINELETEESKRVFGLLAIKKRIKRRLIAEGASEQDAEDVAANVANSVCEDGCPGGCTIKQDQSGWLWRRNNNPNQWYPGKAIGEAAVDTKNILFFGIRLFIWSIVIGVVLFLSAIVFVGYLLFRK